MIKALLLIAGALTMTAGWAQSVSRETYDFNYIGQPLPDPVLQHSKETFVLFGCAYCHGLDLVSRGEATDLMHSTLVGRDENGNLIGPLLRAGIPQTAKLSPMPQFSDLSDQQIGALVRWIHYARAQGRYKELIDSKSPGPGNAAAGKSYFDEKCASCHSVSGDLANVGGKYDPSTLRQRILRPMPLDAASWEVSRLHDTKTAAARQRHQGLLENYSAADVQNLGAYLQTAR
ncbi:MAG TPA: c-type cytochrome [Bryobacteraceae bacterium]|nr:c-type cytochrome [Bryobacteraceae bacterium]